MFSLLIINRRSQGLVIAGLSIIIMAPNLMNNGEETVCISDSFHFSSFYASSSNLNLAALQDDDSLQANVPRSRAGSEADSLAPTMEDGPVHKPLTVANPDRVKLKFYR